MRPNLLALCLAAFAGSLLLSACAERQEPRPLATLPPKVASPHQASSPVQRPSPPQSQPIRPSQAWRGEAWSGPASAGWSDLPGWAEEDHAAALRAFAAGCTERRASPLANICARARAMGEVDEADARAFLEASFRPAPAGEDGLLTAYFTPIYEAREFPDDEFSAAVRPRPLNIPRAGAPAGTYADRSEIEAQATLEALAWLRPEDLFFLQVQGSGVLVFPDGTRRRAVFDGSNGAPFTAIAVPLRAQGELAPSDASGNAVHAWLAANRGERAQAVMDLDRRYVFFRLIPDDGGAPAGAAGLRLTPGRAVAVDPQRHTLGEVLWIDGEAPTLRGAAVSYRRLAMALDTGGAIRGDVRADLYLGVGPQAGLEAGRVRHRLKLWRLEPVADATP